MRPVHAIASFRRLASVSLIAHPNVVENLRLRHAPESVHYMAMELLSGRSLGLGTRRETDAHATALKVRDAACEGLAAAHERDVIHLRHQAGEHVLQNTPGSDVVTVKILDLGIGRLLAGRLTHRPSTPG